MKNFAKYIFFGLAFVLVSGCQKETNIIPKPGDFEIWLQHDSYYPCSIAVPAGTTITWINKDNYYHTVTSNINGLFDSDQIPKGRSFRYKFSSEGTYTYYCKNHLGSCSGMIGIVDVK